MNKLTDLEICKKIAEIEGVELFNSYSIIFDKKLLINMYMDKGVKWHHAAESEKCFFTKVYSIPSQYHKAVYNPLTDDALCFKFCYEDEITVNKCVEVINGELVWNGKYYARHPKNGNFGSVADTPNKAVCLEIIEAHKNDEQ